MTSVQRSEPVARPSAPPSTAKASPAARGDEAAEGSAFELPSAAPEAAQGPAEDQAVPASPGATAPGAAPLPTDPALAAIMAALTSSASGAAGIVPAASPGESAKAETETEEEPNGGEAPALAVELLGEVAEIPTPEQPTAPVIVDASGETAVSPPNSPAVETTAVSPPTASTVETTASTVETMAGAERGAAETGPRATPHRPDQPVFGELTSHPGQGLAWGRPEHTPHQGVGQAPGETTRDPRLEQVVGDKANPEAKPSERLPEGPAATPAASPSASPSFESLLKAGPEPGAPAQRGETSSAAPAPADHAGPEAEARNAMPLVPKVPLGAVPIEIGLRSLAGVNRFEIRLDPEDLGGIEVRLDIASGGEVTAHLVVERPETLALLQRDARSLERAFEQAGLKPSENGLDFSLRDSGSQGGRQDREGERGAGRGGPARPDGPAQGSETSPLPAPKRVWHGTAGVDLRI